MARQQQIAETAKGQRPRITAVAGAARPRNSAVAHETRQRERQLAALYDLWRAVPHTDATRLLPMIAERVAEAFDGHTCSLLLRDRGGDTLRIAASVGLAQDVAESVTLVVGERIAGRVAATGQPILVNRDPNTHPLLAPNTDDATTQSSPITPRPEVESALCAPLVAASGEVLGVLCVSRLAALSRTPFSDADLRVFSLFAAQTGATVAQWRAAEDTARASDETLRHDAEAARRMVEAARQGRREAQERLAALVARELRNPLSSIKGAAQYLLRECSGGEESGATPAILCDFLGIMVEETDGLGRITAELLEFAQPQPSRRSRCDLVALLHEQAAAARCISPSVSVREVYELPSADGGSPGAAWTDMDPEQGTRAVAALLRNAVQAAGGGKGRVTIRLRQETGDFWGVTVEDNGPGFPPALRERSAAGEPFTTTRGRGLGLGLALAHRFAEAHGGSLLIENAPGGGTGARVSLRLPSEEGAALHASR